MKIKKDKDIINVDSSDPLFFQINDVKTGTYLDKNGKQMGYALVRRKNTDEIFNEKPNASDFISNTKTYFENGILKFNGKEIDFNRKPNQHDLLQTLFQDPNKDWFYDELQGEWDEQWDGVRNNNPNSKKYWGKFYNAGYDINNTVDRETGVDDFILMNTGTGGKIRINSKYLDKI